MELTAEFNKDYSIRKASAGVLEIRQSSNGGSNYMTYDFNLRLLTARSGSSDGGLMVLPFSQLDTETLEALRNKLIELEGKPPELPVDGFQLEKPKPKEFGM